MQKRTSPLKFSDLPEKSVLNSVSNLSTKVLTDAALRDLHEAARGGGTGMLYLTSRFAQRTTLRGGVVISPR